MFAEHLNGKAAGRAGAGTRWRRCGGALRRSRNGPRNGRVYADADRADVELRPIASKANAFDDAIIFGDLVGKLNVLNVAYDTPLGGSRVVAENVPGVKAVRDHLALVEPMSGMVLDSPEGLLVRRATE